MKCQGLTPYPKGIRVPAPILKQAKIESHVELTLEANSIVLRPLKNRPREGWEKAFGLMHDRKEDKLLDKGLDSELADWEWK
ncbi:MAG: AbrB/MazE/SpoVT family DNA-binding domain-containing protein [Nitrospinae bacterium]|nr:AbrB/MazE/SpoVT family DNA-binding domain-containing protein [Nitrospinota bacterium]